MNKIMKKNHFSLWRKARLLSVAAVGALLLSSCAQDGFDDDERWSSSVTGVTLPNVEDISISASADGSQTVIEWNVVKGAGGYLCTVMDVTDTENPAVVDGIQNSLIDRCKIAVTREADHNYTFSIKTAGNEELNNTGAEADTLVAFNSFMPSYMTIPSGSDLAAWFQLNPMPDDKKQENLCYDLEPGGIYTLSAPIDFFDQIVTLRSTSKTNCATITIEENAKFKTARGFTLKNLNIDCTNATKALIELTDQLDPSIKDLVGTKGAYFIQDPISLVSCNVKNLGTSLISSNKIYYVVRNFIVDDSVVKLNKTENSDAIINFNSAGYASHFLVQKSTIWDSGTNAEYFFSQYGGRPKDLVDNDSEIQSMAFRNSTLYKVSQKKKFSNQRAKGQAHNEYIVTNCIISESGTEKFLSGLIEQESKNPKTEYINNTYWWNGADASANNINKDGLDKSGTALTTDPQFADPANGDFTVGDGTEQLAKRTGDPRWLPAN